MDSNKYDSSSFQQDKGVQKQTRTFKLDLKSTRNDDSKIKIASLLDNAMIPKIFPDQYTSGNQLERQAIALSLKQYDGNNNYFPQQQSQTQRRNVSQLELMNKNEISGQRFNTKYFNNQELETSKYQETKLIGFPILQLDQKSKYDIDVQGKAEVIPIIEPYRPMKFNDYQYPSARDVSKNKLDGTIGINNALENYRSQINKSGLTENVQIMRPISSLTNNTISYENQITYINEGQQIDPPSLLGYPFKDLTEYKHHIETLQNNDEQADSINDNSVGFNQNNTNTSIIQLKEKPTFWNKFESLIGEKFERVRINYNLKLKKLSKYEIIPDKHLIFSNLNMNKEYQSLEELLMIKDQILIKKRPDYERTLSCGLYHQANRFDVYLLNDNLKLKHYKILKIIEDSPFICRCGIVCSQYKPFYSKLIGARSKKLQYVNFERKFKFSCCGIQSPEILVYSRSKLSYLG